MKKSYNTKTKKIIHSTAKEQDYALQYANRKVISAFPEVFSLKSNDYSDFVVRKSASKLMGQNWTNIGKRLRFSMIRVIDETTKKAKG